MTELDPNALDAAAVRMTLAASAMHPLDLKLLARATIAAYLDERRKQGWVEIEIGNGEPDWTMADHFAASLDRGIAAERESCAKIVEDAGSLTSESDLAEAAADAFNAGSARRTAAERICAYSAVVAAAIRARSNLAQGEEKG